MNPFKSIFVLTLLFIFPVSNLFSDEHPVTFNNYRCSFGAGIGSSPFSFFNKDIANYKPYKLSTAFEWVMSPQFSIQIGLQNEQFKFNTYPTLSLSNSSYTGTPYFKTKINASTNINTLIFDLRKYSFRNGSLAPYGRYLLYGLSFSRTSLMNETFVVQVDDPKNGQLELVFPANKNNITTSAMRFGVGRKRYLGEKLKSFIDFQFVCSIRFEDRVRNETGIKYGIYLTTNKLLKSTSLCQFNLLYGFSF